MSFMMGVSIVPDKIDVQVDVNKIARVSKKIFDLLMRRTKKPYEVYAIVLILRTVFEEELGFNEEGFKTLFDEFKRLD